jgi:hypothetical protein
MRPGWPGGVNRGGRRALRGDGVRTIGGMRRFLALLLWCFVSTGLPAQTNPAFDLTGPRIDVHVKRGETTLPIGQVPSLLPGDRIWVHPDLPDSQSEHFVLVVAFLRGATNPPPADWFTRVETWTPSVRNEGVFVIVPAEAQQALLFLAPETGGDFATLRRAVHDRPGAFVRAGQDLQAASLDRMRLEAYLAEVNAISQTDPALLKDRTERAARSLGIKLDSQCFDKPTDQQAPCLVQHSDGLVLDDTNAQSLVSQLMNGSTADLMNQISYSSLGGAGAYSPYVGAIVDTARILASLHTAHFQYIPALALSMKDTLNLRLNVPPSFRDPKSVVVVALPPVGPAKPPPLHPMNESAEYCAQKPGLVLPVEGAPLVFATQMASNLTLHVETREKGKTAAAGKTSAVDIPVKADPSEGGLVLTEPAPLLADAEVTAELRGKWGFDEWKGPKFRLHSAQPGKWALGAGEQLALVVGREDKLRLEGDSSLCVDRVEMQSGDGKPKLLAWTSPKAEDLKADNLEVSIPLKETVPGTVSVAIYQHGLEKPQTLTFKSYAEAASLERLTLSAGEANATLEGTRLDEVAKARLDGIELKPAGLNRVQDKDELQMSANNSTANLVPGKRYVAKVELVDGREVSVAATVIVPRPAVTLLSKGTQDGSAATQSPVHLGSADDLPIDQRFVFFLKTRVPDSFPRNEKVEVAATDGSFKTVLSLEDGSLMLEDAKTAIGMIEPLTRFGSSAFGPLQARVTTADGLAGDWLPLGTLVRMPGFKELHCPRNPAKACTLMGSNLFLAASIGASPGFENATEIPADFTGTQLTVPHPTNNLLYLKLRDDPATVQTLTLPVLPAIAGGYAPAQTMPAQTEPAPAAPAAVVPGAGSSPEKSGP